jgi:aryl-alcohol dehydrogenase-like predicted oxidoreductase
LKFAIGTAGWRTHYGSFSHEILKESEARVLLNRAWDLGFEFIDTAPSYGDSEKFLGAINPNQKMATKITIDPNCPNDIPKSIRKSQFNLNLASLPLVFVHNWDMLSDNLKSETAKILDDQLEKKNITRWGISTYEYSELLKITDLQFKNIAVQINCNVLDQRIENISDRVRQDLNSNNIEIWARSIFLQGILVNQTSENQFLKNSNIRNFFDKITLLNLSPLEVCLHYIMQTSLIDVAVLGILSVSQLEDIERIILKSNLNLDFKVFQNSDLDLIDPRRWKQ